ncbi:glycosyltransferase family protein [Nocardia stercoris]|uniref:glycosyltransferase family 2 protein n=1 Tax=Nocardia stercoris TaxID=2483361 RepID=UPI0018F3890E|nr:glycosyltransferase family 2 protein [Nocardia stercoris]
MAAYESIAAQELPAGWGWEWVVQGDGLDQAGIGAVLPGDERVRFGVGRHGGAGVARTSALGRVSGELVKVLDSDDRLAAGVLARDIAVLADNDIGWTTSRALDVLPDGSTRGFDHDPPEGVLARGAVLAHWRAHGRAPVHPATLCIRTDLLLALGGWMGLPASEDTGLLLAADAVADGYFSAEIGLFYRKWPGQVTGQAAHVDRGDVAARHAVIGRRAEVLARSFPHWRG